MSNTFPASARAPSTSSLISNTPTRVSVSHSGKRNVRSNATQRYSAKLQWNNLSRAEMMPVAAFIEAMRGQFNNFLMGLEDYNVPLGSWAGSPVVNVAAQTGYTLNLRGLTAGQTGIAKAGDLINIGTDPKVYRVVADANSDGSGLASITLAQALMSSPADAAAIVSSNVQFTFACATDLSETPVVPGLWYNYALTVVEDV